MSSFEIEIKSLLGEEKYANRLISDMEKLDPNTKLIGENSQLNHYFDGNDFDKLYENTKDLFSGAEQDKLKLILNNGSNFSVRTREVDSDVRFVVKASIGDDSSHNGVSRMEFDESVDGKTLEELDNIILDSNFEYQAKWSRTRKEYTCSDAVVCIDKNAGYGYLAEFEKVVSDESLSKTVEEEIRSLMSSLNCEELPQDRLERMFSHYNKNWPKYYGTEEVFVIM